MAFEEELGEAFDVFGFAVGEAAGVDAGENLIDGEVGHFLGCGADFEEGGGDKVDAFVGALGGEEDGDEEGEGVGVVEGNGDGGVEAVEDGFGGVGAFLFGHADSLFI